MKYLLLKFLAYAARLYVDGLYKLHGNIKPRGYVLFILSFWNVINRSERKIRGRATQLQN